MTEFNARAYWEDRIQTNLGLHGVGYLGYGTPYNDWMYRVRAVVMRRTVRSLPIDLSRSNVLDIGSGVGFYVRLWRELGAKHVTGSGLTGVAVNALRASYPGIDGGRLGIRRRLAPG